MIISPPSFLKYSLSHWNNLSNCFTRILNITAKDEGSWILNITIGVTLYGSV